MGDSAAALAGDPKAELLRMSLSLAVPLLIERYHNEGRSPEWLIAHAQDVWNDKAAHQHEALLYRVRPSKRNGAEFPGTAKVFSWFAEAVACAALVAEGGINILGLHFCPGTCARCEGQESAMPVRLALDDDDELELREAGQ